VENDKFYSVYGDGLQVRVTLVLNTARVSRNPRGRLHECCGVCIDRTSPPDRDDENEVLSKAALNSGARLRL
jgi:hypothetical protein